jgi:hypothetical protein
MGEIVPQPGEPLIFIEMDRRDQQQIVLAATGEVIDELIYTVKGQVAISWAGVNHIAFWMGDIEVDPDVKWERVVMFGDRVYWSATVRARNTKYGLASLGTAEAPELTEIHAVNDAGGWVKNTDGSWRMQLVEDPHCRRKALSMAQRNAKRAVIPAAALGRWLSYFLELRKFSQGKLDAEPAPPFKPKIVEADYEVKPSPKDTQTQKPGPVARLGPPPTPLPGAKITEKDIHYRLRAAGAEQGTVGTHVEGGGYVVEPTRELTDEEQYFINDALVPLGATWVEKGYYGRWVVPGEVPKRRGQP